MDALTTLAGAEMRFPYNSPRFLGPSTVGGAPSPKLPLGTGTPPLRSNLAILSRKAPAVCAPPPAEDTTLGVGDVGRAVAPPFVAFRCSRAAMRSLRFVG